MINPSSVGSEARVRRVAGFTLIEVMIVVVIVAILLSVALPGYQESMRKGRRADAKAALMDVANRQERLMLDRSTYTIEMADLGFGTAPNPTMISQEGHYGITAAPCAGGTIATCYVLTATAIENGAQDGDARCLTFVLASTGAKTATGSTPTECW